MKKKKKEWYSLVFGMKANIQFCCFAGCLYNVTDKKKAIFPVHFEMSSNDGQILPCLCYPSRENHFW